MGSCTAGGAYVPAMCDESIIVMNRGTIFLGGPPLVKAPTGEVVSAEDLGRRRCAYRISGVADHLAENDQHALAIARRIVANLNRKKNPPVDLQQPPSSRSIRGRSVRRHSDRRQEAFLTCARSSPASSTAPEFDEFKAPLRHHAGLRLRARIWGYPVGIVANNGILFGESR